MSKNNEFAFIGGDLRQFYMAEELSKNGSRVCAYGMEMIHELEDIVVASSLKEAMDFCKTVICPIPFSRNQTDIFSNNFQHDMTVENFISCLKDHHRIYGGNFTKNVKEVCNVKKISCLDLMEEEEISIKNAVATAEGTIAEAIIKSPGNLHQSSCLILGFGRCAKVLALKLKAMDMDVTVAVRSKEQLAMAEACGYKALHLDKLMQHLKDFSFIFNTIPALVLTSQVLELVRKDVLIIDIASKPGGTDFEKAKELGIDAFLCLGLPGKYAPKASAKILIEFIKQIGVFIL